MTGNTVKIGVIVGLVAAVLIGSLVHASHVARRQVEATNVVVVTNWSSYRPEDNYAITIHRDGLATFVGGPEVLLPGEHRIMVAPDKAEALFQRMQDMSFLGMRPLYKGWVRPSDRSKLCLRGPDYEHCVEVASSPLFGAGEPDAFNDLWKAVQQTASPDRWLRATPETIDLFRDEGLDPRSIGGQRLVFVAVQSYDLPVVQALIDGGFPIDAVRDDPADHLSTPVEVAAYNGRIDVMRALVKAGAWKSAGPDAQQRVLRAAARSCQPEVVQAVFDEGVVLRPDAMTVDVLTCRSGIPQTADPLATAVLMLKHGLPVRARAADGRTLLHYVSRSDVVRLLLRHGADPKARDADGVPPLLTVGEEDAAIALIEAGADIDVTHEGAGRGLSGASIDAIAARDDWVRVQALVNARRTQAYARKD